jgi:hypothetical protein
MLKTLVSAVLIAFSGAVLAQAPAEGAKPRGERRVDCSKAKDPKALVVGLATARAANVKARRACEGRKGDEGRDCMRREMCAQTKDPAKRRARAAARAARRAQIREACKDKKGEELRSCIRAERQKK